MCKNVNNLLKKMASLLPTSFFVIALLLTSGIVSLTEYIFHLKSYKT